MYNEKIEGLISAALADGVLTEKEKQVLFKRAQDEGIDLDEFEMVLDARLVELEKAEKEKAEKSAPKSSKYGDVRKCPNCGAIVPALAVSCQECGFEFSGLSSNSTSSVLANKILEVDVQVEQELNQAKKQIRHTTSWDYEINELEKKYKKILIRRKRDAILSISIPNTKEDLFEFIASLQVKAGESKIGSAYQKKLEECIIKANTLFPNDLKFQHLIDKAKKAKQRRLIMKAISLFLILSSIVGLFFLIRSCNLQGPSRCEEEMARCVNKGNTQKALKLLLNCYEPTWIDYNCVESLIKAFLEEGDVASAEMVFKTTKKSGEIIMKKYIDDREFDKAEKIFTEISDHARYYYQESTNYYYSDIFESYIFQCSIVILADKGLDEAIAFVKKKTPEIYLKYDNYCYHDKKINRTKAVSLTISDISLKLKSYGTLQ